ncbi:hypothetical protein ACSMDF_06955 [Yersinia enterocolitica]
MARNDSFNQQWASAPAQFERPGDGLIARGWAGGASEDPPEAKWENWWHNRVDLALQELQNLGQLMWFADAPYQVGTRVNHGGNSYIALSENTGVEPTGALDIGVWRQEGINAYLQTINNLSEIKLAGPEAMASALENIGALSTTGTAASATKLENARKISGVDFDGTKDITLPFISTTDTNIQLPGNLGVRNLEVHPMPSSTEGGQIDFFDKADEPVSFIDIDTNGNFRIVIVNIGAVLAINRLTGRITITKETAVTGAFSATGNISVTGRGDINGDLRGGRVLSKTDIVAGEGRPEGHASLSVDGNVYGTAWSGGNLHTHIGNNTNGYGVVAMARGASVVQSYTIEAPAGTYATNSGTSTMRYRALYFQRPTGTWVQMGGDIG